MAVRAFCTNIALKALEHYKKGTPSFQATDELFLSGVHVYMGISYTDIPYGM